MVFEGVGALAWIILGALLSTALKELAGYVGHLFRRKKDQFATATDAATIEPELRQRVEQLIEGFEFYTTTHEDAWELSDKAQLLISQAEADLPHVQRYARKDAFRIRMLTCLLRIFVRGIQRELSRMEELRRNVHQRSPFQELLAERMRRHLESLKVKYELYRGDPDSLMMNRRMQLTQEFSVVNERDLNPH